MVDRSGEAVGAGHHRTRHPQRGRGSGARGPIRPGCPVRTHGRGADRAGAARALPVAARQRPCPRRPGPAAAGVAGARGTPAGRRAHGPNRPSPAGRSATTWPPTPMTTGCSTELGIGSDLLPVVVPSGTPIGTVAGAVADRLGLGSGVLVVTGGFDQAMATLGAGVTEAGTAHLGMGSYEALTAPLDRPRTEEHLRAGGWSVGRTVAGTSRWSTMSSWLGGAAIDWLARSVRGDGRDGRPHPRAAAARGHPGSGTHPCARRTRGRRCDIRWPGPGHGRGATWRPRSWRPSCLDLRRALADLRRAGITVDSLRATGGGARSRRWLQLTADVTGLPVERVQVRDAGAFAAGLMAGAAVGMLPPADVAARDLVRIDRRAEPRPELGDHYARRAELHAALGVAIRRPSSVATG